MAGSWQQITAASRESAFDAAQADPEFIEGSRAGSRMDTCDQKLTWAGQRRPEARLARLCPGRSRRCCRIAQSSWALLRRCSRSGNPAWCTGDGQSASREWQTRIVRRTELAPTPPIARTPLGVRDGDDNNLGRRQSVDDVVGEAGQQEPASAAVCRERRPHFWGRLEALDGFDNGFKQLAPQTLAESLVPLDGFGELLRGVGVNTKRSGHRAARPRSMRRFTSSQGSSRALPDSMAATRRSISCAHAVSAPGSSGPSRLAKSSAASSALASTSSFRASTSTACAALVMERFYDAGRRPTSACSRRRRCDRGATQLKGNR